MPRKLVKPAGEAGGVLVTPRAVPSSSESVPAVEPATAAAAVTEVAPVAEQVVSEQEHMPPDGWAAHRRLIRATLPKVEGSEPPPRPIPEFTMHQRPPSRGFHGRGFRHGGPGQGNGGPSNNGFRTNHSNGAPFRDGDGPDGNRPVQPGGGKPGGGRRRRRRRR